MWMRRWREEGADVHEIDGTAEQRGIPEFTLRSADNPEEYLVISTWQTVDDWKKWLGSKERSTVQEKIDKILGKKTEYEVFQYPEKSVSLRSFKGYEGG